MPVIKSAIKKMRQDIKRRRANRLKKDSLKMMIKKAQKEPTEKNVRAAISLADKATKVNLIHKNKAAHLKSSLAKLLRKGTIKQEPQKQQRSRVAKKRSLKVKSS